VQSVLAGVRRLTLLADGASDCDAVLRALARELLSSLGAEEVHVHHLGAGDEELVAVYMFDGDGKLSYLLPRSERPPGVSWVASTGRSVLIADGRELAESVPRLAQTGAASSALLLALAERGAVEAVVMLVRRLPGAFDERSVELARTLVDQAGAALALVRARAEAGTDAVAGCMNHRAMRRRLDEEIGRATRAGSPLSCILIDLDDFKLVNDQHGHQAGDAVLREVVQALVGEFRAFDRVARYGGDEFVVILPGANLERAMETAEALRQAIADAVFFEPGAEHEHGAVPLPRITASLGVASYRDHLAPGGTARRRESTFLRLADSAMYRAKANGRNRVELADPED